jgi:phosphate uptake regulator
MTRSTTLRHLAELEAHVAESTSLVARQERIVTNLERIGQDAARASRILEALRALQVSESLQLEAIRSSLRE